jgi:superfamily II DNA or RNA helicase
MGHADADAERHLEYRAFLDAKQVRHVASGFEAPALNPGLFDWQAELVRWAVRRGSAALWLDCGLGKTFMQLEWARVVLERTKRDVLILAPLAVSGQTQREATKFGIEAHVARAAADVKPGINITNYERLDKFDPARFGAVVLDESSILKSFDGTLRQQITEFALKMPYRLACTATPAPNDYMELGNHSEFVGSLSRTEMLSTFFTHDGGETSKWRLKRHAEDEFWKWISSWAVYVRRPSDIGYSDDGFDLPKLNVTSHIIEAPPLEGMLFATEARTLTEQRAARRQSLDERVKLAAKLANGNKQPWVIWCDLNDESEALHEAIPDSIEVTGSMDLDKKESALEAFTQGRERVIVTKPSMAGFGLNWQHCPNMIFAGLSHSFEKYYQAIRRCWRFGQQKPVSVHVIMSEAETSVLANIKRKERDAEKMAERISIHMKDLMKTQLGKVREEKPEIEIEERSADGWRAVLGDCVQAIRNEPDASVGYSIFSPPFASLYTYSDALADMGNCRDTAEFFEHMKFLATELYRVTIPGRNLSFHCMNLPSSKERDGFIGVKDFRGDLIRMFQAAGFIFHSEVCIWKDPVTAMQRTKAIGLLYKQLRKDSVISRQGIPDYLVTMRKPGVNPAPVTKTHESFPVGEWQQYASPVWMDINPSDTLQRESAREEEDERHICPLQLEVIRRAVRLWSNPGDVVLSPFMGIGSEGYIAVQMQRRFVGFELKRSYWEQACKNLATAAVEQTPLFAAEVP